MQSSLARGGILTGLDYVEPRKKYTSSMDRKFYGHDKEKGHFEVFVQRSCKMLDDMLSRSNHIDIVFPVVLGDSTRTDKPFFRGSFLAPPYAKLVAPTMVIPDARFKKQILKDEVSGLNIYCMKSENYGHNLIVYSGTKLSVDGKPPEDFYEVELNYRAVSNPRFEIDRTCALTGIVDAGSQLAASNQKTLAELKNHPSVWWNNVPLEWFSEICQDMYRKLLERSGLEEDAFIKKYAGQACEFCHTRFPWEEEIDFYRFQISQNGKRDLVQKAIVYGFVPLDLGCKMGHDSLERTQRAYSPGL